VGPPGRGSVLHWDLWKPELLLVGGVDTTCGKETPETFFEKGTAACTGRHHGQGREDHKEKTVMGRMREPGCHPPLKEEKGTERKVWKSRTRLLK